MNRQNNSFSHTWVTLWLWGENTRLAPDTPGVNEGLLKTTEIINLNLNADLVVLSACDTGGGRNHR
ncbi:CHAT domain-containing protein [Nostoc sphaeroides]|uniref:CHAT domain-containing protein n=1 Tax=Nostoc sphaeroides TaxID=446679 RepID=UPI0030B8C3BF